MFDRILNTPLGNFVFYLDFEVDYDVKMGHYVSGKNDNNVSTKEIKIGKDNLKIKVNNWNDLTRFFILFHFDFGFCSLGIFYYNEC